MGCKDLGVKKSESVKTKLNSFILCWAQEQRKESRVGCLQLIINGLLHLLANIISWIKNLECEPKLFENGLYDMECYLKRTDISGFLSFCMSPIVGFELVI